jgi:hypothetical protein
MALLVYSKPNRSKVRHVMLDEICHIRLKISNLTVLLTAHLDINFIPVTNLMHNFITALYMIRTVLR